MRNFVLASVAVIGLGAGSLALSGARAATVDTFNFSQAGWAYANLVDGTEYLGIPRPTALLTGSFTGTVEPSGLIELGDLTAFSDLFTGGGGDIEAAQDLATTTLFSYNTEGGASSLDIAGPSAPEAASATCVGAAAPFDGNCNYSFQISFAPGIDGAVFMDGGTLIAVTTDQPIVTLVSSVTTPPTEPVPEPPSSVLFLTGLVVMLGVTRGTRRFRDTAVDPEVSARRRPSSRRRPFGASILGPGRWNGRSNCRFRGRDAGQVQPSQLSPERPRRRSSGLTPLAEGITSPAAPSSSRPSAALRRRPNCAGPCRRRSACAASSTAGWPPGRRSAPSPGGRGRGEGTEPQPNGNRSSVRMRARTELSSSRTSAFVKRITRTP